MSLRIAVDDAALAVFCRRHRIARLSFFGSVLRDDFGPDSDVDVLVEFDPGARVTLFDLSDIQHELSELLERPAHVSMPETLSKHFRGRVLSEAETRYVAA